jgi:hypothetical protein
MSCFKLLINRRLTAANSTSLHWTNKDIRDPEVLVLRACVALPVPLIKG